MHATLVWMEDTLSRKRKVVQLNLPKMDMVDEILQRTSTPNPKKFKITTRLVDDGDSGNLHLEIAHPSA